MDHFTLKESHLYGLRSLGQHMVGRARENGGDTAKPLAFVGLVTIALGATMLLKAQRQVQRKGGPVGLGMTNGRRSSWACPIEV